MTTMISGLWERRARRHAARAALTQAVVRYVDLVHLLHRASPAHRVGLYQQLSSTAIELATAISIVERWSPLCARHCQAVHHEALLLDALAAIDESRGDRTALETARHHIFLSWPDLWSSARDVFDRLALAQTDIDYATALRELHQRLHTTRLASPDASQILLTIADAIRGYDVEPAVIPLSADDPSTPDCPPSQRTVRSRAIPGDLGRDRRPRRSRSPRVGRDHPVRHADRVGCRCGHGATACH